MRLFSTVFIIIIISFLFGNILNKIETIDQLENQLKYQTDNLIYKIDSLYYEIDTLIWEAEINFLENICPNINNNTTHLLSAIIHVESSGNDSAYNASEDAVGCLQIRQCMVNDVNRILKRQGKTKRYYYKDRWCRTKSIEIFDIVCKHYKWDTAEEIARCWNGGPRGMNYQSTTAYWRKVQKGLAS